MFESQLSCIHKILSCFLLFSLRKKEKTTETFQCKMTNRLFKLLHNYKMPLTFLFKIFQPVEIFFQKKDWELICRLQDFFSQKKK